MGRLILTRVVIGALAFTAFSACSSFDNNPSAERLPDGKHPLVLNASIGSPLTRASGKEAWHGGEIISVMMSGDPVPCLYSIRTPAGEAEPADESSQLFWPDTSPASVTAWWPSSSGTVTYDISDQSAGYEGFDFLFAETTGSWLAPVDLRFSHQMAKVSFTLVAGTGLFDADLEGATVTLFGDTHAGVTDGRLSAADDSEGEISPMRHGTSGEAVLVPQDMSELGFIRIVIGENIYIYTPPSGHADLKAGYSYSYTLTLNADNTLTMKTASVEP